MRILVAVLILGMLAPAPLGGQEDRHTGVYVNGVPVTTQQIGDLQRRLGVPEAAPIPPGRYWYDRVSGLWGMEGGPTVGQIFPGIDVGGPLDPAASGGGTGVFINGRELHPAEVALLRRLFGFVLPGRYWMNADGVGGPEGGPPLFDLRAAAQAAGAAGYTRRTPFGGLGGDGNCHYYLHPNGSSVSNCE